MNPRAGRSPGWLGSVGPVRVGIRRDGRRPLATFVVSAALGVTLGGAGAVAPAIGPAHLATSGSAGVAAGSAVAARTRLPDAPWLAEGGDGRWLFGRGDRPPIRRLPAGEVGLAIDPTTVATVIPAADGHSLVRFRETATGRTLADVAMPMWVSAGAFAQGGLVVTGYADAAMTSDGGLLLVAPASGAVTTLVERGAFPAALGSPVARGDVLVSPSGRTVGSNACGPERCALQVVDLTTGRVSRPVDGGVGFLRAITDDAIVTTDDAGRWIRGLSIAGGRLRWQRDDAALIDPATLDDGSVVGLVGSTTTGWAIAAIDGRGALHDLTPRRTGSTPPRLWRAVTSPSVVVVGQVSFEEALASRAATSVRLITHPDGRSRSVGVQLPAGAEPIR